MSANQDWDSARPNLRICLSSPGDVPAAEAVISWTLAPGLLAILSYTDSHGMGMVGSHAIEMWQHSADQLWREALENMVSEPVPEVSPIGGPDTPMVLLLGESLCTATNVLWLDRYLALDPQRGALVGVVSRKALLAHAIHDSRTGETSRVMVETIGKLFGEAEHAVSDDLYWWRGGGLISLRVERLNKEIRIHAPDELIALLSSLPPA